MKNSNKFILILLFCLPFANLSCGGESESATAKNIVMKVSSSAIVLPTNLDDTLGQTCISGGAKGPRVRLHASINWLGTTNLLPLVITMAINDSRLSASYNGAIAADKGKESLASFFGQTATDFIAPNLGVVTSTTCSFDYGGLPIPRSPLTGSSELQIPVMLTMSGVARDSDGNDIPFTKQLLATVTYMAGSVPAN